MKKLITLTAIFLCSFSALFAETPENRKENPHEIRIGIADSYMEACIEKPDLDSYPTCVPITYKKGPLNHTGHIFVEYQYRVNNWFSIHGIMNTLKKDTILTKKNTILQNYQLFQPYVLPISTTN